MEDQKPNWNGFPFPNLPFDFKSSVCDVHKLLLHEDNKFSAQGSLFWLIKIVSVFSNPVSGNFMDVWILEITASGPEGEES